MSCEMVGTALVVHAPGEVSVETRTVAVEPGTGQVVVAPLAVGVCGTDLEIVRGDLDPKSLITHRFGIESAAAALDLLATSDGAPRGKILIEMGQRG